ncbi:hypothetical protein Tco_0160953, partial [Tanacetum coccineum]
MASSDVQEELILYLISQCCDGVDIWEAIKKREGIQLLNSFLGLSGEEHQELLFEMGSYKAMEDAAYVLCNLCCHSDDICACVKSAEA